MNRYHRTPNGQIDNPQPTPEEPNFPDREPPMPMPSPQEPEQSPPIIVITPFYKKPLFWVAIIALLIAIIAVVMYAKEKKVVYEF